MKDPYAAYIDILNLRPHEVIKRELKSHIWYFDRINKELIIYNKENRNFMVLDKVRWFSLFRFLIRAAQKLSVKLRVKTIIH